MVWVNSREIAYYEIEDLRNVGGSTGPGYCLVNFDEQENIFWKLKQPIFDQRLVLPSNKVFTLKDA